jgi:soluble lytic murein transglycosylase
MPDEQRLALFSRGRSELLSGQYSTAQTTFALFAEQFPDDDLTPAAHFNRALALESLGRYSDAIAAYQASLLPDSPIAAYIYERLGDLALLQDQPEAAINWYMAGAEATDGAGFQVHLREGIAEAHLNQEHYDEAIAEYEAILNIARIPAYRAKISRLIGEAYLAAENEEAALAQFQQSLDQYPDAYDSYLALVTLVNRNLPVNEFQRGYTDYYGGQAYQPAAEAMARYLAGGATDRADEAAWIMGLARRASGDYPRAIDAFDRLINQYPDSAFWDEAHLERARTLGWRGDADAAIAAYRQFAASYANSPAAPEALWRAALLELNAHRLDDAQRNFRAVAQQYPASPLADEALYWGGIAAYQNGQLAEAETTWADLLTNYPASDLARPASFWQAKALLTLGQSEQAQPLLQQLVGQPFNYYGLRARDILAADNPLAAPALGTALNLAPLSTEAEAQLQAEAETWLANWLGLSETARLSSLDRQIQSDPAFTRAEMLHTFGLLEEALEEYETVKATWNDNPLAMYQLALHFKEQGAYRLSILSAVRLVELSPTTDPADVPNFIRRLIYPTYFHGLVLAQAERFNLDPALVFALIRQESLFQPDARSHADARGLMQVIPPTGADIAQRTNTNDYTHDSLFLPYRSIEFGAWFLRSMLDFLDGHQFAALAAYNAGPGNVQSWQPFPEDLDIFVAQIPLLEPREYIRRIYLNLANYREIYQ